MSFELVSIKPTTNDFLYDTMYIKYVQVNLLCDSGYSKLILEDKKIKKQN